MEKVDSANWGSREQPQDWWQRPAPPLEEEEAPPRSRWLWWWERGQKHLPFFILLLLLGAFLLSHRGSAPAEDFSGAPLEVLMPLFPVAKGQRVRGEMLKSIPLSRKSLSKTQLLQVVRSEDFEQLRDRVVAKKNLPPQQALFWHDLDFLPEAPAGPPPSPHILFPQ